MLRAGDEEIAVEIELDDKHSLVNVSEDLKAFDQVSVVSPYEHVVEQAERRVRMELSEEENKRIRFMKMEELLR